MEIGSAIALMLLTPAVAQPDADVLPDLKIVKCVALEKKISAQRGKIVMVYLWAAYCAPAMRTFPDAVKLHEKYSRQGVVLITVSLDPKESKDRVARFLERTKVRHPAFLLDEDHGEQSRKLNVTATPAFVIVGRDGKRVTIDLTQDDQGSLIERTERRLKEALTKKAR